MGTIYIPGQGAVTIDAESGQVSDGYHTFDELYEHRCLLFIALMRAEGRGWISRKHADGTMFDGWFVAGLMLATGEITYHLPDRLWSLCLKNKICEFDRAPSWDGHTPSDVVTRLGLSLELLDEQNSR